MSLCLLKRKCGNVDIFSGRARRETEERLSSRGKYNFLYSDIATTFFRLATKAIDLPPPNLVLLLMQLNQRLLH